MTQAIKILPYAVAHNRPDIIAHALVYSAIVVQSSNGHPPKADVAYPLPVKGAQRASETQARRTASEP